MSDGHADYMTLLERTAQATRESLQRKTIIDTVAKALFSTEFKCPGGHRKDGVKGDIYDYREEMMDEMGFPPELSFHDLTPKQQHALESRLRDNWIESGACDQTVEISMEYEGEYAEISYPVAHGSCVAALGLDEGEDYDHPLWQVAAERRRLAKILREAQRATSSIVLGAADDPTPGGEAALPLGDVHPATEH